MVYFRVEDSFHSHPKATVVSLAALGLWAVAGSWSGDHLTDGFVPDHQIPLLSRGASKLADELVAAGLWRRVRGGYRFHEWTGDGNGFKRNPTKKEVLETRAKRAEAGRKGGLTSGKRRSKRQANATAGAKAALQPQDLLPSKEGEGGRSGAHKAPPAPPPHPFTDDGSGTCATCELPKRNRSHLHAVEG